MSKAYLRFLKDDEGGPAIWGYHNERRWWLHLWNHCLRFEHGRVKGLRWAEFKYGDGYVEGIQLSAGFGYGAWLTWEIPWALRKRLPVLKSSSERVWGLTHSGGRLRLLFGHNWLGDWYGHRKGLSGRLSRLMNNREVCLFNWEWVTGRDKVDRIETHATRRMLLPVGEWPGDEYVVEVKGEEMVWRNRFRTIRRKYWDFRTPDGEKAPPIPGNPESDFYDGDDALYGFSVDQDEDPAAGFARRVVEARRRHSKEGWRPREVTA